MSAVLILQPFANGGDVSNPPQTSPGGFVNWQQGYTPYYEIDLTAGDPQAKAVERQVQNSLFNTITANLQAWQQLGFAPWFSTMPGGYGINAQIVRQNGSGVWIPYRSKTDGNVTDPNTSPANWEPTPSAADMLANIPMPAGGAGGSTNEIVTAATDFNSFGTGSWEFKTDAVAASSPHSPSPLGGATAAGLLECKVWASAPNTYAVQRYTDRNSNSFFRGYTNGTWTAWSATAPAPTYSTDTSSTVNLVSATFPMASSVIADNAQFWVKIANTNNGAVTFTPNPSVVVTPKNVSGQAGLPLQGAEIVAAGRALFIYRADSDDFVLAFCSGGAEQVPAGTKSNHAVSLSQLNATTNSYAADTSVTPNVVQATFPGGLTTGNIADNQRFWVKVANANTGAATFTPNPGTFPASPITGGNNSALQGGEFAASARVCFIWKADTNSFFLSESSNGAVQVANATASHQAVPLLQVQTLIAGSGQLVYVNASQAVFPGIGYNVDTEGTLSGSIILDLPSAPPQGSAISFKDALTTWGVSNAQVRRGGTDTIVGLTTNYLLDVFGAEVILIYKGTNWSDQ